MHYRSRQRDGETERERDRGTERQRDRETERQRDRQHIEIDTDTHATTYTRFQFTISVVR